MIVGQYENYGFINNFRGAGLMRHSAGRKFLNNLENHPHLGGIPVAALGAV
jgi:hypothetical protein